MRTVQRVELCKRLGQRNVGVTVQSHVALDACHVAFANLSGWGMHASHPPLHARADVVGFPSFSQLELLVEQRTRRRRRAPPPPYAAVRAAT